MQNSLCGRCRLEGAAYYFPYWDVAVALHGLLTNSIASLVKS